MHAVTVWTDLEGQAVQADGLAIGRGETPGQGTPDAPVIAEESQDPTSVNWLCVAISQQDSSPPFQTIHIYTQRQI